MGITNDWRRRRVFYEHLRNLLLIQRSFNSFSRHIQMKTVILEGSLIFWPLRGNLHITILLEERG